ncbi:MAG: FAD-dependent oxidoreductase [Rhizobiaceae bacterium]
MTPEHHRIAIIGAGMAGLTCASRLARAGASPVVFEKSRGIGGRLATRRAGDKGEFAFDHGAQYIRSRQGDFSNMLDQLERKGSVGQWGAKRFDSTEDDDRPLFVGMPAMNQLLKPLAEGLDLRQNTQIKSIIASNEGWLLSDDDGVIGTFDHVVTTVPADQARGLLARQDELLNDIKEVEIWPCWSLMVALQEPIECGFDQWRYVSAEMGWLARNSSKPGRGASECWVMHARPEWSQENLEAGQDDICKEMLEIFRRTMSEAGAAKLPAIVHAAAHRWRYAQTATPLGRPFVQNPDGTLLVGGDWALGARVECAFESGAAMADALLEKLGNAGAAL